MKRKKNKYTFETQVYHTGLQLNALETLLGIVLIVIEFALIYAVFYACK